MQKKSVTSD